MFTLTGIPESTDVIVPLDSLNAQRIPDEFIWFAGTGLFAPFVAIPIKLGILRLLKLEARLSRLWSISAIEWLLWFPLGFFVIQPIRSSSVPLMVLSLFGAVVWVHRARLADVSWRSALFLSFTTPILAPLLPFLAFGVTAFFHSHFA